VETVAHTPVVAPQRLKKTHPMRRTSEGQRVEAARVRGPRVMNTSFGEPAADQQPRLTLTVASGNQVQQFVVPAVAYVPAYAAVRTPDGWIILQL
jgi:hypothetical protein